LCVTALSCLALVTDCVADVACTVIDIGKPALNVALSLRDIVDMYMQKHFINVIVSSFVGRLIRIFHVALTEFSAFMNADVKL